MIQHIIPINDKQKHSEKVINHIGLLIPLCKCEPKTIQEYMSDDIIFVHCSFDGREALEECLSILNVRTKS